MHSLSLWARAGLGGEILAFSGDKFVLEASSQAEMGCSLSAIPTPSSISLS